MSVTTLVGLERAADRLAPALFLLLAATVSTALAFAGA